MTSFAGMSLCTVIVALIPAWHDTTVTQRTRFRRLLRQSEEEAKSDNTALDNVSRRPSLELHDSVQNGKRHRWLARSTKLLGNLCDLQLLTGTAIIIAAHVQGDALSFYHQAIILNYWWLALNSFWAARQCEGEDTNSSHCRDTRQRHRSSDYPPTPLAAGAIQLDAFLRGSERFRSYLRRLLILICTTAFCILYGRASAAENSEWDSLVSGRCYISHDQDNSNWFWLTGLVFYALVLLLTLVNKTKQIVSASSTCLHYGEDQLFKVCVRKWRRLRASSAVPRPAQTWKLRIRTVGAWVILVGVVFLTLIYSACFQFLAIWWFGDGFYALEVAFYIGMWAWSFYDIVDLKLSNKTLIVGNEMAWGFGQVLAVVLMGVLVFYVVDGLGEERDEERRNEVTSM
jgi:hypothetical protein